MAALERVIVLRKVLLAAGVAAASVAAVHAWKGWVLKAPATPGSLVYVHAPGKEEISNHPPAVVRVGLDFKHFGPRLRRGAVVVLVWVLVALLLDQLISDLRLPFFAMHDPEVRLRNVSDADVELFYEHQREPEANRVAAFPPREREAFFKHWEAIRKDPAVVIRTIERGGRVAGNIATFKRGELREICYWLGREHWGQGAATDALRLFLEEIETRPLYARIAKLNVGSLRVAGKCGFKIVGEDAYKSAGGDTVEEYLLELKS